MDGFVEIKPGKKRFQRFYLATMLRLVGRAIQAAARVDEEIKEEFNAMPGNFTFSLGAFPKGPYMVIGKNNKGKVKYMGANIQKRPVDLEINLKSMGHFFKLFTFQESTITATARDRMFVSGDVPQACAIVRILDIVQVFLLPRFLAELAVRRYPRWTLKRHIVTRARILFATVTGI